MNIYLDSIGCRLNQAEIESFARQFRAQGHFLVESAETADCAIINTCTVTRAADSDSRAAIRRLARAGVSNLIVTGCWSTLNPLEAAHLQGVSKVVPNNQKDALVPNILDIPEEIFDFEPVERRTIPGARFRPRSFIKVQDGCDNRCTFCITTLARGSGSSRSMSEILADMRAVLESGTGAQEIVLTGVHLGSWGMDLDPALQLKDLVTAILRDVEVPRLRLSSLEPWDIKPDFFELWDEPRLCRHLHFPLQTGCAATLRRMARKTTPEDFAELIITAREAIPDVAITTDVITGFPGENDQEFAESLDFVKSMAFAGGHVFTYSPRPGTAAATMDDQVPREVRKVRNARMREVFAESASIYHSRFIGKTLPVLWESADILGSNGWRLNGLTDNYLRVRVHSEQKLWNEITPVTLLGSSSKGMIGEITDGGALSR